MGSLHKVGAKLVPARLKQPMQSLRVTGREVKYDLKKLFFKINDRPIIVLGNQKSGTTVMAALLAQLTGSSLTLDLRRENNRPVYPFLKNGCEDWEDFLSRNRIEFSQDIIKEPNLTILYKELADSFPEARFVYVLREPRDNIRSILNRLGLPGNLPSLTNEQWKSMPLRWRYAVDCRYLGFEADNYIEMLAHRWRCLVDVYLQNTENFILCTYEDFLKDKIGEIKRLAEKLGIPETDDISAKVDVQYEPKGDRDISWIDFFGENNLFTIENICKERMQKIGYRLEKRR